MKTKPSELIIGKKDKKNLSKPQQAFNRLVKKLEKLRKESENDTKELNELLDFYVKHLHPLEQEETNLRKELVRLLYKLYRETKLSKKDKEVLTQIMTAQLNHIFELGQDKPDDEIKEIFEFIEGTSFEEAAKEDFEAMKDDMTETFRNLGVDIDLEGFDHDLSEEEMMRKLAEMLGNIQEQAEAKEAQKPPRKKTKKQIEKEEREKQIEEVKNKSIAGIYKQLARAFHPDLEQDPQLKTEKEEMMKKITGAYENNDLHTLLRMELEWIHKEEANLEKLSEEKLSIYNDVLKEQIAEIEEEMEMTARHPRYAPLRRYSGFFGIFDIDIKAEKRQLQKMIKDMNADLLELKGDNSLKKLKDIIAISKKAKPKLNLFDMDLEDFFR